MIIEIVLDKYGISAVSLDHDKERRNQNQLDSIERNSAIAQTAGKGNEPPQHDEHNRGASTGRGRKAQHQVTPHILRKGSTVNAARPIAQRS